MAIEVAFVSAGCSPEHNVLDIDNNGEFLGYGSSSNTLLVHVRDPDRKTVLLPNGPSGQVHVVKLFTQVDLIISGSADGKICTWTLDGSTGPSYKNDAGINSLDAISTVDGLIIVFFADINGRLHQLKLHRNELIAVGSPLSFGLKKIISLSVDQVDGEEVCFIGTSDNLISVIVQGKVVLSLAGHSNWINSIDTLRQVNGALLVATGSSDRSVRIWRVAPKIKESRELTELVPSRKEFLLSGKEYCVECESILYGHEGMINSVRWDRESETLLSAAADHTIIRWRPSNDGTSWQSCLQIGDISSLGTVGSDRSFGFTRQF